MVKYLAVFWLVLVYNMLATQEFFLIHFQRTGGFAGITTVIEVDSKTLGHEEIDKVNQLIDQANFFAYQKSDSLKKNVPDQFQYVIAIESHNAKKTIEFTDSTVPDNFQPLINYLTQKARSK